MPEASTDRSCADRLLVGIGWRHPHYGELLEQQPAIGFLEVHSENFFALGGAALEVLRQGRKLYPVSLHGVGLSLGSANGIDPWHLARLAQLVERIEPVRVSDHACFARGSLPRVNGTLEVHASDLLPVPFSAQALDVMVSNVQQVQDRLQRPISVENLSAYVQWRNNEMTEGQFLSELARRSGCGLLVDVNNIYVNALNARLAGDTSDPLQSCCQWLDAIPAQAVTEIHLAGHADCGDIVIDDHGSRVSAPVWALYRHALQRFGAVATLVEWDTDVPALDVLLQQAELANAEMGRAQVRQSVPGPLP